jgi:hypothetical protein
MKARSEERVTPVDSNALPKRHQPREVRSLRVVEHLEGTKVPRLQSLSL